MYIEKLGIPKQKVTQLNAADILYTEDVVQRYPSKYLDFRNPVTNFDDCKDGIYSIVGVIASIENKGKYFYARIKGEGRRYIYAYWFNQTFLINQLSEGKKYIFCGKITIKSEFNNQIQILPMFFSEDISKYAKIFPKYKKIKGMSDDYYKEIVDKCLNLFETEDYLLPEDVKRFDLISENDAFMKIHRPQTQEDIEEAKIAFYSILFSLSSLKWNTKTGKTSQRRLIFPFLLVSLGTNLCRNCLLNLQTTSRTFFVVFIPESNRKIVSTLSFRAM